MAKKVSIGNFANMQAFNQFLKALENGTTFMNGKEEIDLSNVEELDLEAVRIHYPNFKNRVGEDKRELDFDQIQALFKALSKRGDIQTLNISGVPLLGGKNGVYPDEKEAESSILSGEAAKKWKVLASLIEGNQSLEKLVCNNHLLTYKRMKENKELKEQLENQYPSPFFEKVFGEKGKKGFFEKLESMIAKKDPKEMFTRGEIYNLMIEKGKPFDEFNKKAEVRILLDGVLKGLNENMGDAKKQEDFVKELKNEYLKKKQEFDNIKTIVDYCENKEDSFIKDIERKMETNESIRIYTPDDKQKALPELRAEAAKVIGSEREKAAIINQNLEFSGTIVKTFEDQFAAEYEKYEERIQKQNISDPANNLLYRISLSSDIHEKSRISKEAQELAASIQISIKYKANKNLQDAEKTKNREPINNGISQGSYDEYIERVNKLIARNQKAHGSQWLHGKGSLAPQLEALKVEIQKLNPAIQVKLGAESLASVEPNSQRPRKPSKQ